MASAARLLRGRRSRRWSGAAWPPRRTGPAPAGRRGAGIPAGPRCARGWRSTDMTRLSGPTSRTSAWKIWASWNSAGPVLGGGAHPQEGHVAHQGGDLGEVDHRVHVQQALQEGLGAARRIGVHVGDQGHAADRRVQGGADGEAVDVEAAPAEGGGDPVQDAGLVVGGDDEDSEHGDHLGEGAGRLGSWIMSWSRPPGGMSG